MQVTTYTVNEQGLNEIKEFLAANHKKGGDHFTRDMLQAWAADAEFQLSEGNSATIEIKSWDSIHGYTQEYRISDAGLDAESLAIAAKLGNGNVSDGNVSDGIRKALKQAAER